MSQSLLWLFVWLWKKVVCLIESFVGNSFGEDLVSWFVCGNIWCTIIMVNGWSNRDSFWKLFCCWLVGSLVTWVFVCLVQYMMFGLFDFVLGLDVNELLGNASLCQYACLIYTNPSELSVLKLNKSFHWYLYLKLPLSFIAALCFLFNFWGWYSLANEVATSSHSKTIALFLVIEIGE